VLHFYLAGINNQNFLMRDRETGTWWQQVTGKAIFGPMKGQALELVPSDELTFGLWKGETTGGQVLAPVAADEKNYERNWESEVAKLPVVISFPGSALKDRDVIVGVERGGSARAYPFVSLSTESPVQDRLGGAPILLLLGPDAKSVRGFVSRLEGVDLEFFSKKGSTNWTLIDSRDGGEWSFRGCAESGPNRGKCLEPLPVLKDYWFDWRNYHPSTSVYRH
jgi:Protein of unknown function (DUF3179)